MNLKLNFKTRNGLPFGRIKEIQILGQSEIDIFGGKEQNFQWDVIFIPPKKRTLHFQKFCQYLSGQIVSSPLMKLV